MRKYTSVKVSLIILSVTLLSGCAREQITFDKQTNQWVRSTQVLDFQKIIDRELDKTLNANPIENSREQLRRSMNGGQSNEFGF